MYREKRNHSDLTLLVSLQNFFATRNHVINKTLSSKFKKYFAIKKSLKTSIRLRHTFQYTLFVYENNRDVRNVIVYDEVELRKYVGKAVSDGT